MLRVVSMKNRFSIFIGFLTLVVCGCKPSGGSNHVISSEQADFRIVTVVQGLHHPWSVAFLPDGDYLVTERRGNLWRISRDGAKAEIKGVPDVYHEGQGGLLDIILEPDFNDGGFVYFSYAAMAQDNMEIANTEVARARLNLKQNRLSDVEVIFKAEPKVEGNNHWGSRLLFARDGMLHITLGERYHYSQEAQNPANHLGTTIRIMPDGSVPPDNPFVNGEAGDPKVFTYGNRNVQGIALHPQSGEVWAHEHGPKGGDEVNILKGGANYGWPAVTFGINYWGTKISDKTSAPGMEDPVLQWTPSIAPSGMAFYSADVFPEWKGDLFVGALAHRHLRRIELDGDKAVGQEELFKDLGMRIRDVRQGRDGLLYILTDEDNGALLRLVPVQ